MTCIRRVPKSYGKADASQCERRSRLLHPMTPTQKTLGMSRGFFVLERVMRLELTTYSMASCRSSQLSYTRMRVGFIGAMGKSSSTFFEATDAQGLIPVGQWDSFWVLLRCGKGPGHTIQHGPHPTSEGFWHWDETHLANHILTFMAIDECQKFPQCGH